MTRIGKILTKLTELGVSADVRERIEINSPQNFDVAERYFIAKADGWHIFTEDDGHFKGREGYLVIEWRSL